MATMVQIKCASFCQRFDTDLTYNRCTGCLKISDSAYIVKTILLFLFFLLSFVLSIFLSFVRSFLHPLLLSSYLTINEYCDIVCYVSRSY